MYRSYGYSVYGLIPMAYPAYRSSITKDCLPTALQLAREAVQGEKADELFYDYLISVAPDQEQKDIIASIRDDEKKHNRMFREIVRNLSGQEIPPGDGEAFEKPSSYIEGIKKALFGELKAVEKYRNIRKCLPEGAYRDMLFEIITDELKHASKYNYLFTLNQGGKK